VSTSDGPGNSVLLGALPPAPDAAAARERVWRLFERLDRLDAEDLRRVALPEPDPERLAELRAAVADAAADTGRVAMLDEAQAMAREVALRRFGDALYRPTWLGLNWAQSMGPPDDRARVALALEHALAGAVVEDRLDPDLVDELSEGFDRLEGMRRTGPPEGSSETALHSRLPLARIVAVLVLVAFAGQLVLGAAAAAGPIGAGAVLAAIAGIVLLLVRSQGGRGGP
jgi:hypothetical protein